MRTEDVLDEYIKEKIFIALGEVSLCWENKDNAGVFNSNKASAIGERLLEDLRAAVYKTFKDVDCSPKLGMASTQEIIYELITRLGEPIDGEVGFIPAQRRIFELSFLLGSLSEKSREYRTRELI